MDSLYENPRSGNVSMEDLIPKKVRFREECGIKSGEVLPDVPIESKASWKDKLVGISSIVGNALEEKEDYEFLDGDFQKSVVNDSIMKRFTWKVRGLFSANIRRFNLGRYPSIQHKISRVAKLDMNIDNKVRGQFARMVMYVNLDEPLVSQVLVNGKIQRIEYEFLPTVCFHCGRALDQLDSSRLLQLELDVRDELVNLFDHD
ncbi:hypothetical protein Goklo_001507 [Gossypium klotzschianum]|uniref:DUF4283 domain-containing protein n=1 Tax=Gossypium klotzschianum TaxID=34286 RepID=A0A7J8W0L7_9ROSI|nr:hypothetical protein [Gossypium klotzschianum]